jgi:succinyl-diaminopimelate desuccinylase
MPGIAAEVSGDAELRPATMSDPAAPVVASMLAANRAVGLDATLTGFSMATDGGFFAAAGCPTIVSGPGDPPLAHVTDEWVGVEEVMHATRAYA